jgi:CBS domain-containing protein
MTIGTICNRDVVVARKDTAIQEAARLMREYHVGDLVVVEDRGAVRIPVGIVTDRDLVVGVLAAGVAPGTVAVGDVMTINIISGHESDSIWATLQRMRTQGIRRLPVVDGSGGLVGVLTMDDLFELFASELADLSRIVRREQDREKAART